LKTLRLFYVLRVILLERGLIQTRKQVESKLFH